MDNSLRDNQAQRKETTEHSPAQSKMRTHKQVVSANHVRPRYDKPRCLSESNLSRLGCMAP